MNGEAHVHSHGSGHSHAHGSHGHAHSSGDKGRMLLAAVLTGGFMVVEAIGGLLTGSLALLADAAHMLTDAVALTLGYLAFRISERPGTSRLTYGFDRLKVLVAYTNGLAVFAIALWIAFEAAQRFASPAPVLGGSMLAIAASGLMLNALVFAILHGGDRHSLNMRGATLHVVGDMLGSIAAMAAALIILLTGWTAADPVLSLLVCLLLVRSAWSLIGESGHILLEGAPAEIDRNAVARDLAEHSAGVENVHHMHVWSLDERRKLATLHAKLQCGADAEVSIRAIKSRLASAHGIAHATVEVETGPDCPDEHVRRNHHGKA